MINSIKLVIPDNVRYVIEKLNSRGFEAFLVGGCVRDCFLEREPYDWDITTNALPQNVKDIFGKTYDTGIKHGTVSVAVNDAFIEVTTYRIDGEYSDFRRPDKVEFTSSLSDDLERRDFTINAMAYHPKDGLIDFFDGLKDLDNCSIRAVGDANLRFKEDALRMLRAIRFSAQLDFDIESSTFDAIKNNSELIKNISMERVRDELNKILISENPMHFDYLYQTGLLDFIIPELTTCYSTIQNNPYHVYNVAEHILHSVKYVRNSNILRWTMLLHDVGKPQRRTTDEKGIDHFYGHQQLSSEMAGIILTRLRFDKESIRKITKLVFYHDMDLHDTEKSIKRAIGKIGDDLFMDLLDVQRADAMAQNRAYLDKRIIEMDNINKIYFNIKKENHCLGKKDMAINGDDLIELGMKPGKDMRDMLEYLLECVLENPQLNKKQELIELAKKKILY